MCPEVEIQFVSFDSHSLILSKMWFCFVRIMVIRLSVQSTKVKSTR